MLGAIIPVVMAGNTPLNFDTTVGYESAAGGDRYGYIKVNAVGSTSPSNPSYGSDEVTAVWSGRFVSVDWELILYIDDSGGTPPTQNSIRGVVCDSPSGIRTYSVADVGEYGTLGTTAIWKWGSGNSNPVWGASANTNTYAVNILI